MKKLTFDEIIEYLKDNDFRRVSLEGPNKQTYLNSDHNITITIEEHKEILSKEDENIIKKRLKELGYLSEDEGI